MYFVALSLGLTEEGEGGGAAEAHNGKKYRAECNSGGEQVAVIVVVNQAEVLRNQ